jgi:hypothetical protein
MKQGTFLKKWLQEALNKKNELHFFKFKPASLGRKLI